MKMTLDANAKERKDLPFEEDFPSLKSYLGDERVNCVTFSEVKKYCLDKQRVKDDMNKSVFIEHLTVKQQQELFDILEGRK